MINFFVFWIDEKLGNSVRVSDVRCIVCFMCDSDDFVFKEIWYLNNEGIDKNRDDDKFCFLDGVNYICF